MNPAELPVFPLNSPLLPGCRMPLQIFEKRYLDMVSHCLRTQGSFVVALLRPGSEQHEVISADSSVDGKAIPFYTLGTEARIVDFGQRDNGLLAITIEGQQRMQLQQIHQTKDSLWKATALPAPEQPDSHGGSMDEWRDLLQHLLGLGGLEAIREHLDLESDVQVTNYLVMLLPLPAAVKQDLLQTGSLSVRRNKLASVLALLGAPASPSSQ